MGGSERREEWEGNRAQEARHQDREKITHLGNSGNDGGTLVADEQN